MIFVGLFLCRLLSTGWAGIWFEWMLPTERGLLSSRRPLIDVLSNSVGRIKARLHSRGHMHAAPRSQFPPLASCRSPSRFAFTPLRRSHLCHSQFLAASLCLLTLVTYPWCSPYHFLFIYLSILLLLHVSLSLIVLFLSISSSHWSHLFFCFLLIACILCPASSLLEKAPKLLNQRMSALYAHRRRLVCVKWDNVRLIII